MTQENASPHPPTTEPPSPPPGVDLIYAADRRDSAPLLDALRSQDPRHRRAAAWLLSRVPEERSQVNLAHALSDPDAVVRDYAATALAVHERALPVPLQHSLLGALASETDASARVAMISALGRIATTVAEPALEQALAHGGEGERVAACRALGARTADSWPRSVLERAAMRAADDALPSVREACWFGLGRTPLASLDANEVLAAAIRASTDTSTEIRGNAIRVLGRLEPTDDARQALAHRTQDTEWRVAIQALRALLQTRPSEPLLLQTLADVEAHWWPDARTPTAGALHVLLTAIDIASGQARSTPINAHAVALHARASRTTEPASRDQGLLHCASARLVDLGRGWPTRVESCGLDQLSEAERAVLAADVLAHAEGAAAQRETFLRRLFRSPEPRVREAVLTAAGSLPAQSANAWVHQGIADIDVGVLIAALELAATLATQAREARDAEVMQATLEGRSLPDAPFLPALVAATASIQPRLTELNHPEAWVTFHHLVALLADSANRTQLAPLVAAQRHHAVDAVRASASDAERALGLESAPGEIAPVPNPVAQLQLDARLLRLTTTRGEIEILLTPDLAPTTVTRIAELTESGFYNGLTFHRVVPGFVVQGGDPRGDGYGDAGWSQRCEDSPTPYERGVVGMALAGRDTGGSQFFITTGPAHHLNGRYPAFGRVTRGLEVVDALQAGDVITRAVIERGEPQAPYPAEVLVR